MNDHPRASQHSHGDGNAVVGGDINGPLTINNYAAPKDVGPDEAALQRGYLQWVMTQCRPLSLAAIDYSGEDPNAPRLGLDQVYTALRANWQSRSLDEASASSDEAYSARVLVPTSHLASALRFVDANPRAVLLGAPGSGKSTFVNFLALCLAGELLQDPGSNLARLTAPLPDDAGEDQEERQVWSDSALIPVRVILRLCGQ